MSGAFPEPLPDVSGRGERVTVTSGRACEMTYDGGDPPTVTQGGRGVAGGQVLCDSHWSGRGGSGRGGSGVGRGGGTGIAVGDRGLGNTGSAVRGRGTGVQTAETVARSVIRLSPLAPFHLTSPLPGITTPNRGQGGDSVCKGVDQHGLLLNPSLNSL